MATVEFTRAADRDLIDIYLHGVTCFGPVQAERYLAMLNDKAEIAALHPDFGADYGFVRPGLRRYEAASHALYYRTTRSGILVLRVGWMRGGIWGDELECKEKLALRLTSKG